jgi:hypothetical protein
LKAAGAFLSLFVIAFSVGAIAGPIQEATVACPDGVSRDSQIMTELGYLVTAANMISPTKHDVRDVLNRARGGNKSGSPLGCYFCNPPLTFHSIYPSEPSDMVVAWTYDLRRFMQEQEGSPDMRRSVQHSIDKMPDYRKVREFALCWWEKTQSAAFADLLPLSREAFVYDAIVDGVNIWSYYESLSGIGSADSVSYNDVLLNTYRKASASDIFF